MNVYGDRFFVELAHGKLVRVLGQAKGEELMKQILQELQLTTISNAEELLLFARVLQNHAGFASAVGALLGVQAVIHGARN